MKKKVLTAFFLTLSAAFLLFTSLSSAGDTELSSDWASFIVNEKYEVMNNVWNKNARSGDYTQSVIKGKDYFGWKWNWKGDGKWVLSYPEVMCGDSPWNDNKNLHPGFPFKAGSKKLTVDFDIDLQTTGKCDMAFEFWALSKLPSKKEHISQEVMIWNYNKTGDSWSWAKNLGTFEADGIVYDVYFKGNHGDDSGANDNKWSYTAFVARKPYMKGKLSVSLFIDFLMKKNIITKDNYIANFELGNEVWYGTGTAKIKKYDVKVE